MSNRSKEWRKLKSLYSEIYQELSDKGILDKDFYTTIYYNKIEKAYRKKCIDIWNMHTKHSVFYSGEKSSFSVLKDAAKKTLLFYESRNQGKDIYNSLKKEPLDYPRSENIKDNWTNYQKSLIARFNKEDEPIGRDWYHDYITNNLTTTNKDFGEIEEILSYVENISELDEILAVLESSRGIEKLERYNKRRAYNLRQISKAKEATYKEGCKEPTITQMKETLRHSLIELHNTKPYKAKRIVRILNYL